VQRQLVEALGRLMEPGGRVFLQSDVLEVCRPVLHHCQPFLVAACLPALASPLSVCTCQCVSHAVAATFLTCISFSLHRLLLSICSQVAEHMRDTFEQHGSAWFAPCQQQHAGPTFLAASEPKPKPAAQPQRQQQQQQQPEPGEQQVGASLGQQPEQPAEQQEQEPPEERWQSQWAAAGWLQDNPLVSAAPPPCCCEACCWHLLLWQCAAAACGWLSPVHQPHSDHRQLPPLAVLLTLLQGVPTEREVLTTEQGLPVYRIMLRRT
jgi:hypothetical protein